MRKSEFKKLRSSFRANQPTPRRGVLDEEKKAQVVMLIASGLSRREAAGFVQCAHTTIGRTAARDSDFAVKLSQAEATSHMQAVTAIRGAMQDPKYWRAAAWMLERRSPEEYARRDPNSFTGDQVMSLLARLYSEALPLLPAEKVEQFQELFDEALEEVEAKSGRADNPRGEEDRQRTHLAPRDGLAAGNGHVSGINGAAGPQAVAPSNNGHHRPDPAPAAEQAAGNGKPHAESEGTEEPLAEREECLGPDADGGLDRAAFLAELNADLETTVAAKRFLDHAKSGLEGDGPLAAAMLRANQKRRRSIPSAAQLHHPFHQGVGAGPEDCDRKALFENDLQCLPTDCTKDVKPQGRCNNGVVQEAASCEG
jgi:hypothetical protein